MPTTTIGAISTGPAEPFQLREVTVDDPRDDEILVKIAATGICHTDLFFKSVIPAEMGPCLLGHEGAGVVAAVGSAITDVRPGDHVVLSYRSCGRCAFCRDSHPAYCEQTAALNALGHRADGTPKLHSEGNSLLGNYFGQSSFAGYALAGRDNVVPVGNDVDLAVVAALGCGFQTGAGAVLNVLRPQPDSRLIVHGVGSVGFAALLAAEPWGCGPSSRSIRSRPAGPRRRPSGRSQWTRPSTAPTRRSPRRHRVAPRTRWTPRASRR